MTWREVEPRCWAAHPYRIYASRVLKAETFFNVYHLGQLIGKTQTAEAARALCEPCDSD